MASGLFVKVVATMIIWNNVSQASPYFDDVRSGIGEGPVRVWSVQSVVLQILAFGVCLPDEAVHYWNLAFFCVCENTQKNVNTVRKIFF